MFDLSTEASYSKLPLLNEDGTEEATEAATFPILKAKQRPWLKWALSLAALSIVICSTVLVTLAVVSFRNARQTSHHHYHHHDDFPAASSTAQTAMSKVRVSEDKPLHCGNSVEEAIALGCDFDPLMLMWLRPECTRTGTAEYLDFLNGTLSYWVDKEGQIPVADLSRQINDEGFWGEQRQHIAHCAFVYVRLVEAASSDNIYDRKTWSEVHAKHCAHVLLKWAMRAPDVLEAKQWAHVSFGTCWQKRAASGIDGA
jgi:hypothetical protein